MTGYLEYLSEIRSMIPILIKLPDGRFTQSSKQGTFCLGSHLSLQDVFFLYIEVSFDFSITIEP